MTELSKIKNLTDWPKMRSEVEAGVLDVIGPIRREKVDLQLKVVDEYDYRGYVRRRINFFVDSWDRISGWLFLPDGKEDTPAILCCHSEVSQGKDEPAGLEGEPRLALAQHYAELGYATLAIDCIASGERLSPKKVPFDTRHFYKDNPKKSFVSKMIADHMAAIDVFTEVKRIDPARVGVIGHGLGGLNALMLTAFDERVQACVSSCGFTRFETDKEPQRWAQEEGLCLMPGLRPFIESGKYPFDWEHIIALSAPSALMLLSSLSDSPFSNPKSVQKAFTSASKVYKLLGAGGALEQYGHHDGPRLTPESIEIADEWFERWL